MSHYYIILDYPLSSQEKSWVESTFSDYNLSYEYNNDEYKLTGEKTDIYNFCKWWGYDLGQIID